MPDYSYSHYIVKRRKNKALTVFISLMATCMTVFALFFVIFGVEVDCEYYLLECYSGKSELSASYIADSLRARGGAGVRLVETNGNIRVFAAAYLNSEDAQAVLIKQSGEKNVAIYAATYKKRVMLNSFDKRDYLAIKEYITAFYAFTIGGGSAPVAPVFYGKKFESIHKAISLAEIGDASSASSRKTLVEIVLLFHEVLSRL